MKFQLEIKLLLITYWATYWVDMDDKVAPLWVVACSLDESLPKQLLKMFIVPRIVTESPSPPGSYVFPGRGGCMSDSVAVGRALCLGN